MKKLITLCCLAISALQLAAQTTAEEVLNVTRKANDYFMAKYQDPTIPTNVNIWTTLRHGLTFTNGCHETE